MTKAIPSNLRMSAKGIAERFCRKAKSGADEPFLVQGELYVVSWSRNYAKEDKYSGMQRMQLFQTN